MGELRDRIEHDVTRSRAIYRLLKADGKGYFRSYQGGSIYDGPGGTHEVHGAIRDRWMLLGAQTGLLGYPLTDETGTPDGVGRYNHFQNGSIYWTPETGAHETHGAIRDEWQGLDGSEALLVTHSQTRQERPMVLAGTTTSKTARFTGLPEPALMRLTVQSAISGQHSDGSVLFSVIRRAMKGVSTFRLLVPLA
jgi:LGFP repeat